MDHVHNVEVANLCGVNAATLFTNIAYWVNKNKANNENFFDGYYWTFNTYNAFCELFTYMTEKQIRTALKKLIDNDLIITGNYSQKEKNRTLWYTLTQKGEYILRFGQMPLPKMTEQEKKEQQKRQKMCPKSQTVFAEKAELLHTDINTNINTNINTDINIDSGQNAARFIPPTLEEVRTYCRERRNRVNAERFIDHYTANGWKVGRNKMKDWKAAVRQWERNEFSNQKVYGPNGVAINLNEPDDPDDIF